MLNSKTVRLIISLLAAVLIWGYVIGEVNPSKTKTIRNIPITYTYEETLNERGLAIAGAEEEFISLEVSGARAILGYITPNDISATINVASAQRGENDMSITIKVPSGITVNKQSVSRTIVTVEGLAQKPVGITISYSGTFGLGEQGSTVSTSSSHVLVSGAESLVERVAMVQGVVDAASVGETLSATTCQLVPLDSEGREVQGIRLAQKSISVSSILARTKTVPLEVPLKDNTEDRFVREAAVPENVRIFGNVDVLDGVEKLVAQEIDLSSYKADAEANLKFTFPDGIALAEGEEPIATITVSPVEDKEFTFDASEVTIEGIANGSVYTLPQDAVITIKASDKKSVLDLLVKNNFKLSVDVSKMGNSGQAEILVDCSRELYGMEIEPKSLLVEITADTGENSGEGASEENSGN